MFTVNSEGLGICSGKKPERDIFFLRLVLLLYYYFAKYMYLSIHLFIFVFSLDCDYFYSKQFSGRSKWENIIRALLFFAVTCLRFKSLG